MKKACNTFCTWLSENCGRDEGKTWVLRKESNENDRQNAAAGIWWANVNCKGREKVGETWQSDGCISCKRHACVAYAPCAPGTCVAPVRRVDATVVDRCRRAHARRRPRVAAGMENLYGVWHHAATSPWTCTSPRSCTGGHLGETPLVHSHHCTHRTHPLQNLHIHCKLMSASLDTACTALAPGSHRAPLTTSRFH